MQPHQVVMLEVGFCFPPLLLGSKTFAEHQTNVMWLPSWHNYIDVPVQIFLQQEKPLTIFVYNYYQCRHFFQYFLAHLCIKIKSSLY